MIELNVWCQSNADQASGPGQKSRFLNIAVDRTDPAANPGVFDGSNGSGALNLFNISADFAAQFDAGSRYKLTLEPITDEEGAS
jgi:hypothetical protein